MNRYRYGEPGARGPHFRFPFTDEDTVPPWGRDLTRSLTLLTPVIPDDHRRGCKDGSVSDLGGTLWPLIYDPATFLICHSCSCIHAPPVAALKALNPDVDPTIWERWNDGNGNPVGTAEAEPSPQGDSRWLGLISALDAQLTGSDASVALRHANVHAPPHPGAVKLGVGFPLSDGSELIVAPGGALMLVSVDGKRKAQWGQGEARRIEGEIKAMLGQAHTDITAPRDYSPNLSSFFGSKRGGSRR